MNRIYLISIFMILITLCSYGQDNVLVGLNGPAYGVKIKTNFPNYTGNWARGFSITNESDNQYYFGLGSYGACTNGVSSIIYSYLGRQFNDAFMYFKPDGKIGIGTNNPNSLLSVSSATGGGIITVIDTEPNETTANPYISFYHGSDPANLSRLGYIGYGSSSNTDLYVTNDKGGLKFRDNTGEVMYVKNGNVGIGTTSPTRDIQIHRSTSLAGIEVVNTNATGKSVILLGEANTLHRYIYLGYLNPSYNSSNAFQPASGVLYSGASNGMRLISRSHISLFSGGFEKINERLRITPSGHIGIGTTDPGLYKLAVEGKIGAHEIVVTTDGWSDFVFNKDYKLKDLEEVESFIEENNHLPDIPSEKEVIENGIALGEMDAKLLQKIEELTLYMIEMNKEVKALKNENVELREKNVELESEIKKMKSE